jgi:phosphopantetheinyl transferase (holo-ACP synthase)
MSRIAVGNDVVDLTDPRCWGKSESRRFVARVYTAAEAARIRGSDAPDRMLWLLWAAKEAAFKVVSKVAGEPPTFVHAAFEATVSGPAGPHVHGHVTHFDRRIAFVAEMRPEWIHLVAWSDGAVTSGDPPSELRWSLSRVDEVLPGAEPEQLQTIRESRFTQREGPAVHSVASAAVRIAAREGVAAELGTDAEDLEIVCLGGAVGRTPPRLYVGGSPANTDVSLSHHGEVVGWAAALATETGGS